jgi:uncharacterized protein YjbJ (UPF0337 family)
MSVTDKAKHAAMDAKGKIKETAGKVTGNERMQADGEAEQDEARAAHAADQAKDTAKNAGQEVKGKAREVAGAVTGDDKQEAKGKAEQLAAEAKQRLNK